MLKAYKVTDKVYWVGAIDWALRDFHGYQTGHGSTYNAYLILADKITLIDTVKHGFKDEMLARISSVIDPAKIDYIISGHSEMDHSGSIPEVMGIIKPERVIASVMGQKVLSEHFRSGLSVDAVKDGESLSLGNMNLTFVETRMVHWPDSMFTYLHEEQVLFPQDGFGMHLASSERFADEIPEWLIRYEAKKYFANILMPLSELIRKLVVKVGGLNLPLKYIAPAHGPIWRENLGWIVKQYDEWAAQKPNKKAVIFFDTMWGSTGKMAKEIADGIAETGGSAIVMPLHSSHRSEVAAEVLESGALVVGSPTINNEMLPAVADVLTYLKGLKPRNLIGAAFGSYGWSGESIGQVEEILKAMKVEMVADSVKAKWVPDDEAMGRCHELGKQIGQKLVERCG